MEICILVYYSPPFIGAFRADFMRLEDYYIHKSSTHFAFFRPVTRWNLHCAHTHNLCVVSGLVWFLQWLAGRETRCDCVKWLKSSWYGNLVWQSCLRGMTFFTKNHGWLRVWVSFVLCIMHQCSMLVVPSSSCSRRLLPYIYQCTESKWIQRMERR